MTETYCIILRDDTPFSLAPTAQALAAATGRLPIDVTRDLRERVGILASGLTRDQADRAVGSLSQASVSAFALPESNLVEFPQPAFILAARIGDDALEGSDLRDAKNLRLPACRVPFNNTVLLVTAQIRTRIEKLRSAADPHDLIRRAAVASTSFDDGISSAAAYGFELRPRTDTSWQYDHLFDIFAVEPASHLRLNASTFNFLQTGMKMQPTSIANLTEFIKHFALRCDQAHSDPSIRHILDGNPLTNLRFNTPEQYDAYLVWRIQLLYHPDA